MELKYDADPYWKLSSWREIARWEITKWFLLDGYSEEIERTTMTTESIGPFTKFLYHFAWLCNSGWGTMVDFNERSQRIFICDRYYKWMHQLRDEIYEELKET